MTPSKPGDPSQGKPDQEQTELEATEAKQTAATEAAAEQPADAEAKPKPARRRTRAKKAEATAAEVTGEQKDAAAAAVQEGTSEPVAPSAEADDADGEDAGAGDSAAAEEAPAPARRRRRRGSAPAEEPAPAPARKPRQPSGEPVLVRATAKYVRSSPRKARLVCDHIRGKSVEEARAILAYTPRAVARDWSKLLESAIANAEHNHELVGDELRIHKITADAGPTLKRFQPRAMGRATRIRKRTSHLSITLTPKE